MDQLHEQQEDPTSDAARSVGHYLTGALAAADLAVRLRTWLTRRGTPDDLGADGGADVSVRELAGAGQVLDRDGAARAAMLGPDKGAGADSQSALLAWVSSQPHRRDDQQADLVASRAEARLRTLHPDALSRYDALRAGLDPVAAMREVVPLITAEQEQQRARQAFEPMLDSRTAAGADSTQALAAWRAALPLADTLPDAAAAAAAAETRLRELHPAAMNRFDQLRATSTPDEALAEVAPLIDPAVPITGTTDTGTTAGTAGSPAAAGRGGNVEMPEVRYAPVVREVLAADVATEVLRDDAWPALAGALGTVERLGGQPADLLRDAAGQRELASAKSVAEVLQFRLQQRHPDQPQQQVEPRTPTAADLVASSYPMPLAGAPAPARIGGQQGGPDLATLDAGVELGRQSDAERQAARAAAGTCDDTSTPAVDGRGESLTAARTHTRHATADRSASAGLLAQVDTSQAATAAAGASPTATAAPSYPTPVKELTAVQAAPRAAPAAAPAATATVRPAPSAGRR